jgi:hypothetical protein
MDTFVLVHGAWHGGWCWKRVSIRDPRALRLPRVFINCTFEQETTRREELTS